MSLAGRRGYRRLGERFAVPIAALLVLIGAALAIPEPTHAATITWDGGGPTGNWSDALNWSTNTVPGAADTAVFDATSAKPAAIALANVNVGGVQVDATYGGSITQGAGRTITVGPAGWTQSGSSLNGSAAAITVNGPFSLSGGTFTSTTGTLSLAGNLTHSGGTFLHAAGTLRFTGAAATIDVSGTESLWNVNFAHSNAAPKTIAAGDTLVASGLLTFTNGTVDGGTVAARGNLLQTSGFDGGTATLLIDGAGDQTLTGTATAAAGQLPNLVIDKPAGTLTLTGTLRTARDWTYVGGGLDPGTSSVVFAGTQTISGDHALFNVEFRSALVKTIAAGDTLRVGGLLTLTDGSLVGGTVAARGNLLQTSGFDGGTATLLIDGAGDQTLTGTATAAAGQLPNLVIDKPAGTLTLTGTLRTARDWTYVGGGLDPGTSSVVFAGTQTISGDHALFNVEFRSALVKTIAAGDTLRVGGLLTLTDGSLVGGTVAARGNLLQTSGFDGGTATLLIDGAGDQTLTGTATAAAGQLPNLVIDKPAGTLTLTGTLRTARDWTYVGGGLDPGTSSVVFAGTQTISGDHALFNVEFRSALVKTIAAGDTLRVGGLLTLTDGSLVGGTVAARGNLLQTSGFDGGTATLLIDGAGDQTLTGTATAAAGQLPNLVIDKPAGTLTLTGTLRTARDWTYVGGGLDPGTSSVVFAGTLTLTMDGPPLFRVDVRIGTTTLGAPLRTLDDLTVTSGTLATGGQLLEVEDDLLVAGVLDGGGGDVRVAGDVTVTGSFAPGGGRLVLDGTAVQTLTAGTVQFADLTVDNPAGALMASDLDVDGTLELAAGTLTIGPFRLTIANPITGTTTNLVADATSLITIAGSSADIHLPASVTDLGELEITNPQGVAIDGPLTIHATLVLVGGNLVAGPHLVSIDAGGAVSRTMGHVVGSLRKTITAGGAVSVTFEIGDASGYAPVEVSWPSVSTTGTLTASTIGTDPPSLSDSDLDPAASVNRTWTLAPEALAPEPYSVTLTFLVDEDDPTFDPTSSLGAAFDGTTWTLPPVSARTMSSISLDVPAMGAVSFGAAMPAADLAATIAGPTNVIVDVVSTYQVTAYNAGPFAAPSVTLTIDVPEGARLDSVSTPDGACSVVDQTITCDLGSLASGDQATVSLRVSFSPSGVHVLGAAVSVGSGASDPSPTNDSAELSVTAAEPPASQDPSPDLPDTAATAGGISILIGIVMVAALAVLRTAQARTRVGRTRR